MIIVFLCEVPECPACGYVAGGLRSGLPRPAGCHATVTVDEIVDNMPDEKVSGIIADVAA
ncbi:hypothetical protein ACIRD8_26020 [Streptomyces sp. NPDC102451]|uniref:hypothetical protein n=1 Tax=Streptomyces sp. NPDC102451 TaxID=3366177 RepID=UPI0038137C21